MNCVRLSLCTDWAARVVGTTALALLLIAVPDASGAQAQTLTTLHTFTGGMDGGSPTGLVAVDRAANVYGSAPFGARLSCVDGCGAVFRASYRNGTYTFSPLYDFQGGQDGDEPWAGVTLGPDGALYGTTWFGGGSACGSQNMGCGTVFKLTPPASFCRMVLCPWTETVLYRAAGPSDPSIFIGGVILDNAGNIYGMSFGGGTGNCFGAGCGTVYKLTPSGGSYTPSVLYSFQGGNDGAAPAGNLAMDAAGNLYGAATYGGHLGFGTVFKLVHSAGGYTFQLLYTFTDGADGSAPQGSVVLDSAGNLYGSSGDGGGIFQITPSGTYTLIDPLFGEQAPITIDAAGVLYGTDFGGGTHGDGAIFKLAYSNGVWTHTTLHSFGGTDGALPLSGVGFDSSGNLYGTTTYAGGPAGQGTLWQLTP